MNQPLRVGQFAIVDHEPVDRGPNAGIFHGKGPTGDRAELYIVAEGTTPAGESFAGHVVSAVGQAWGSADMSLTGALRRAFREAERNLRDWNRKSIAQHRVSLGMACLGRRGNQAIVAQAGPSAAYHFSGGRLNVLLADEEHGRPIGLGGAAEPQLSRIAFGPGDRLLLLSTAALRTLDDEVIGGLLALPPEAILPDLYHRLRDLRNLTAVLITDPRPAAQLPAPAVQEPEDEGAAELIDATAPGELESVSVQPSLFIGQDGDQAVHSARQRLLEIAPEARVRVAMPVFEAAAPVPLRRASGEAALASLAAEQEARLASARSGAPGWRSMTPSNGGGTAAPLRRLPRNNSFSRGLVPPAGRGPTAPPPAPVDTAPLAEDVARVLQSRAASPAPAAATIAGEVVQTTRNGGSLVRVRDSMGGRWKGNGTLAHRGIAIGGGQPPTWLTVVIGLVLLITLVGVLVVPGLMDEKDGERYSTLIEGAQRKIAEAQLSQDPGARRTALAESRAMLQEAGESPRAGLEAARLLADVTSALTAMDAVTSPSAVQAVANLAQFGNKPVTAARLVAGPEFAAILDSNSAQVISINLATGEARAIYAESKEAGRGRPATIAYVENPDLGGPAILIADAGKMLWAWSPARALRPLAFAAPQGLNLTDIATAGRDLYVLDAGEGVIYRFAPGDNGYSVAPQKVLVTTDLAAARRLMVDGNEYVTADANGTLRWFAGQTTIVLNQGGIDERLVAPEPPQALAPGGAIAVLDAKKSRIAVFNRDGTFLRQFRHKDFEGLSAFAVYEDQAFVFSGGQLRRLTW